MGLLALFGITNDSLNLVVSLLLLCLIAIWMALIVWTYFDARRRIQDPLIVGCATAASLFPFFGTIVYMILRPPEYLIDAHERALEIRAAEARVAQAELMACPYCDFDIERSFLRCPSCLRRLKEPCGTCGKPLDPRWKICPYCESEIGQAAPPQRRRVRSASQARSGAQPRPSQPARPASQPAAAERPASRPASPAARERAARPAAPSRPSAPPAQPRPARPASSGGVARPPQPRPDAR